MGSPDVNFINSYINFSLKEPHEVAVTKVIVREMLMFIKKMP